MAMWLYQVTEGDHFVKGNVPDPGPGDMVVFFFAPTRDGGGTCSTPDFTVGPLLRNSMRTTGRGPWGKMASIMRVPA